MVASLPALGLAVKQLQWRHERTAGTLFLPLGVSLPQWTVLRQVDAVPGASLRELAGMTFQTEQAMGAMAVRMIERGLVVRASGGGRAVRLELTEQGRRMLAAGAAVMDEVLAASFAALDEEDRATLLTLLDRVLGRDGAQAAATGADAAS